MITFKRYTLWFVTFLVLSGCAVLSQKVDFSQLYGQPSVQDRVVQNLEPNQIDYWKDVKPVLDRRCVVCHGCFDAPCQLKLTAVEGIERGAHKLSVYNTTRITPAKPTRLFEDADSVKGWRELDFFSVLNEHIQTPEVNKHAGVMHRILALKRNHPLPNEDILEDFTFGVGREESCPKAEEMDNYARKTPLWGMPYGLPSLASQEQSALERWLEEGASYTQRASIEKEFLALIQQWEALLNQDSLFAQLASRYIYEHLFLANLYFKEISNNTFFKLVRSATPPGRPVQQISTRRPYDNPKVDRVYYRFIPQLETIVSKNHMPYALDKARMRRWETLFFRQDITISKLPRYGTEEGANPFRVFAQLPMQSRYKFMLDEARFTIMNYIKGPVCRGGVALNVINDHFWVFFVNPDLPIGDDIAEMVNTNADNLELPSALGDIYVPLIPWKSYAAQERKNRKKRDQFLVEHFTDDRNKYDLSLVWDGDGQNENAALTIFRHYDNATVEKGLIGRDPKTAWVISYPLLERIHYLLVAGYDVYGNVGHNLLSRIHMDFLRMDGEASFLTLLPQASRAKERNHWYRGAKEATINFLKNPKLEQQIQPDIAYRTNNHKAELFSMLKSHLGDALDSKYDLKHIADTETRRSLERLSRISGAKTQFLSEVSMIEIIDDADNNSRFVSLIKHVGHRNMTAILSESKNILPEENTLTVAYGILGSYPNTYFQVSENQISDFVDAIDAMRTSLDYKRLMDRFGIRRTHKDFWEHSDHLHEVFKKDNPTEFGWLDYNRLENR